MKRGWELVAMCVVAFLLAVVLVFEFARELYLESHTPRRTWSQPGTFDPAKVRD